MPSLFNPISRLYDHVSGLFAKIDDFDPLGTEQGLFARIVGTVQGALASSTSLATGGPVAPDYLPTDPASDEAEGNHTHALMEPNGSRRARAQVLTWEGGLGRDDFPGSVLSPIWTETTSGGALPTSTRSVNTVTPSVSPSVGVTAACTNCPFTKPVESVGSTAISTSSTYHS